MIRGQRLCGLQCIPDALVVCFRPVNVRMSYRIDLAGFHLSKVSLIVGYVPL